MALKLWRKLLEKKLNPPIKNREAIIISQVRVKFRHKVAEKTSAKKDTRKTEGGVASNSFSLYRTHRQRGRKEGSKTHSYSTNQGLLWCLTKTRRRELLKSAAGDSIAVIGWVWHKMNQRRIQ